MKSYRLTSPVPDLGDRARAEHFYALGDQHPARSAERRACYAKAALASLAADKYDEALHLRYERKQARLASVKLPRRMTA